MSPSFVALSSASVRGFVFNVPLKPFNGNHFTNNLTIPFFPPLTAG